MHLRLVVAFQAQHSEVRWVVMSGIVVDMVDLRSAPRVAAHAASIVGSEQHIGAFGIR
jgi:hypothetical protein